MEKKVVFAFGRLNPPSLGHMKMIEKVRSLAKEQGAEPHLYLSHSEDSHSNPIPYNKKLAFARNLFGRDIVKHHDSLLSPHHVMRHLADQGYTHVTMVAGGDRVPEFKKAIGSYVKPASSPNYDPEKHYNLQHFSVVSAGDRDPDAKGVEGMSATKLRDAAKKGDFKTFSSGVPTKDNTLKKSLYAVVRKHLKEEVSQDRLDHFVDFTKEKLGLNKPPKVTLGKTGTTSFGFYNPSTKEVRVQDKGRHVLDTLRTIAHELVHAKQDEEGRIKSTVQDGSDGSEIENEANAMAGVVLRGYGRENADLFNESFDSKVNFTYKNHGDMHSYGFHHDGEHYHVEFIPNIDYGDEKHSSVHDVSFHSGEDGRKSQGQFGTGGHPKDAAKVIGKVMHVIRHHIDSHPEVEHLEFASIGSPSRSKLYDHMAKKIGKGVHSQSFGVRGSKMYSVKVREELQQILKKKIILKKKLPDDLNSSGASTERPNNYPNLPMVDGIGPTFDLQRSPAVVYGMATEAAIRKFINKARNVSNKKAS